VGAGPQVGGAGPHGGGARPALRRRGAPAAAGVGRGCDSYGPMLDDGELMDEDYGLAKALISSE
jgi:hypothetical protein